jgi:hypothetical protein
LYTNPSKTNRVIWNFWSYKMNPRNKSLENRPTKRIHDTNLLNKALQIKSAIRIFKVRICKSGFTSPPAWIRKDSFCAIVLRIRKDSWGFVGFVKTGRIFGKLVYKMNPWKESLKTLRICDPQYETNPDSFCKALIEPFWSQDSWLGYKTNPRLYESLIRFPHPYNLGLCVDFKFISLCFIY